MTEVSPVVEAQNRGTLVYAGGDDLLAFVPTTNALACATKLNEAFRRVATSMEFLKDDKVTCSAAVTVAHYKTPLRIVLNEARVAERRAKDAGRDCLTIATLRRSGELSTAVIPWSSVPNLERFVCDFKDSPDRVTDRWAYQFRRQLELMPSDQPEIWRAELLRILKHAERMSEDFRKRVLDFWDAQVKGDFPGEQPARERAIEFVQVIQAASFLARGARE